MNDYPVERYIDLENNPYLLGRVVVHHVKNDYHAEVDIIHRESHKIFKHIDIIYQQQSAEEALISGIQRLRKFLEDVEKESSKAENQTDKSNHH